MPFPDYSGNGGGERFEGPVESTIKQKAGTGTPLTSPILQDIGRKIDDEIAKVAPPTPTKSRPIDTVEVKGPGIGQCLTLAAGSLMESYPNRMIPYEVVDSYKFDRWYEVEVPVLLAKSTDGTAEIIQIAANSAYAAASGVDRQGWVGPPSGDEFTKWLSGVQATQLNFQKAQFTGDGKTLAMTMYDTDTSSGSAYGNANGLYRIYYHGTLTGNPQYYPNAKCWVGRMFVVDSALIVYTNPTNGKQYVTQIKN